MFLNAAVLAIGLALVPTAEPQAWTVIDLYDGRAIAFDALSIRELGNGRKQMMSAVVYAAPRAGGMMYGTSMMEIDCVRLTLRNVQITDYAQDGRLLGTAPGTGELTPTTQGTISGSFKRAACDGGWDQNPTSPDMASLVSSAHAMMSE